MLDGVGIRELGWIPKMNSEIIWELKIKAMFGSGKFEEKCKKKIDLKLIIIFIYYFKLILVILILIYKN